MHGDTIISGIGQGYILSNCLQMCVMAARAATNLAIRPRLIEGKNEMREEPKFKNLGLDPANIKVVMDGLAKVMQPGGTAASAAINIRGMRMGGKTGTSQVRNISASERLTGVKTNEQLKWEQRNHGLFVGIAPIDNPKFAIAVITEHSGGSGQAARAASSTMAEILRNL
jgi:penicillin-binding protein 2